MRAAVLTVLLLAVAAVPAADAHPVPDSVIASAYPCDLGGTVGHLIDCNGGFLAWMALAIAQHNCEHLFGNC